MKLDKLQNHESQLAGGGHQEKNEKYKRKLFQKVPISRKESSRMELLNSSTSEDLSSPRDLSSPQTPLAFFSPSSLVSSETTTGACGAPSRGATRNSTSENTLSEFLEEEESFEKNSTGSQHGCQSKRVNCENTFGQHEIQNGSRGANFSQQDPNCCYKDQSNATCVQKNDTDIKIITEFKHHSTKELSLFLLVTILTMLSSLLAVLYLKELFFKSTLKEVLPCATPSCLRAASRLLDRMDRTVSPCEDFYQFTCGNYLKKNIVPDDTPYKSSMQEMWEEVLVIIRKMLDEDLDLKASNESVAFIKAKRLYHSCMNTSFTAHEKEMEDSPILDILSEGNVGAWPLLSEGSSWNENDYDLEKTLAHLSIYQVHTFFDSYITPDDKNSSKYMMQFYKGSPALAVNYYLNSTNDEYTGYLSAYRILMEEVTTALNGGKHINSSYIDQLIDFEHAFAEISDSRNCDVDSENVSGNISDSMNITMETDELSEDDNVGRMTVLELELMTPEIEWSRMLQMTMDQFGDLELNVSSMTVAFHCTAFLPKLVSLLAETPKSIIVDYLLWRFIMKYLPFISNYFQQLWRQFRSEVRDPFEERTYQNRWKECAAVTNEGFGAALASVYVKEYYDMATSDKVDVMVERVRSAYNEIIQRQDWLEDDMKEVCSDKLYLMGKKIGYPEYIESIETLDAEFDALEILEDHFLNNILRMKKHEVWKEMKKLKREVDKKKDWLIQPLIVNAFHNPTANEIILPLGILREPFYNPEYPMYINYGSLGVVVGHELVHGFDNHGKKYDKHGNLSQWWSEKMIEEFTERAACFIDQYSQYPLEIIGKNVDGNTTLGDNICDNTGLMNAWLAYSNWMKDNGEEQPLAGVNYTIPQVFLITFGQIWCEVVSKEGYEKYSTDMHSPGIYRTNGVVQNSEFFTKTWNCPLGSTMNPEKKCNLWT